MQHTTNLHQPTRSSILRQSYIRTIYFKQQEHIHITPVNNMTEHKQEAVTTETNPTVTEKLHSFVSAPIDTVKQLADSGKQTVSHAIETTAIPLVNRAEHTLNEVKQTVLEKGEQYLHSYGYHTQHQDSTSGVTTTQPQQGSNAGIEGKQISDKTIHAEPKTTTTTTSSNVPQYSAVITGSTVPQQPQSQSQSQSQTIPAPTADTKQYINYQVPVKEISGEQQHLQPTAAFTQTSESSIVPPVVGEYIGGQPTTYAMKDSNGKQPISTQQPEEQPQPILQPVHEHTYDYDINRFADESPAYHTGGRQIESQAQQAEETKPTLTEQGKDAMSSLSDSIKKSLQGIGGSELPIAGGKVSGTKEAQQVYQQQQQQQQLLRQGGYTPIAQPRDIGQQQPTTLSVTDSPGPTKYGTTPRILQRSVIEDQQRLQQQQPFVRKQLQDDTGKKLEQASTFEEGIAAIMPTIESSPASQQPQQQQQLSPGRHMSWQQPQYQKPQLTIHTGQDTQPSTPVSSQQQQQPKPSEMGQPTTTTKAQQQPDKTEQPPSVMRSIKKWFSKLNRQLSGVDENKYQQEKQLRQKQSMSQGKMIRGASDTDTRPTEHESPLVNHGSRQAHAEHHETCSGAFPRNSQDQLAMPITAAADGW